MVIKLIQRSPEKAAASAHMDRGPRAATRPSLLTPSSLPNIHQLAFEISVFGISFEYPSTSLWNIHKGAF